VTTRSFQRGSDDDERVRTLIPKPSASQIHRRSVPFVAKLLKPGACDDIRWVVEVERKHGTWFWICLDGQPRSSRIRLATVSIHDPSRGIDNFEGLRWHELRERPQIAIIPARVRRTLKEPIPPLSARSAPYFFSVLRMTRFVGE
jgi:hypothetical protein